MEWHHFQYFQVLAGTEHMTKAAERLAISQPALSRAIAKLEVELGCDLFDRRGKYCFLAIEEQVLLPEPTWVEEERKNERVHQLFKKRSYRNWTTQEDKKLIALRSERLSFNVIAVKMKRTPTSVKNRYKLITSPKVGNSYEERNS